MLMTSFTTFHVIYQDTNNIRHEQDISIKTFYSINQDQTFYTTNQGKTFSIKTFVHHPRREENSATGRNVRRNATGSGLGLR